MVGLTNSKNLPIPVVNLANHISSLYDKGDADISTTELIDEPLQRILKRVYAEELVEDVADVQHRMIGTVLHNALAEMEGEEGSVSEQRMFVDINNWVVSGEPDYYSGINSKHLLDYKYTAKYKTKSGIPEEWKKQISIYAYMLRECGKEVETASFCVWYRDAYSKRGDALVENLNCDLYSNESVKSYLETRVAYHQISDPEFNPLIDLSCVPECSEKARWATGTKYAFKKTGRKGAIKIYDTKEEADKAVKDNGTKGYKVEVRKGSSLRCESYCLVSKYCQYQQKREGED